MYINMCGWVGGRDLLEWGRAGRGGGEFGIQEYKKGLGLDFLKPTIGCCSYVDHGCKNSNECFCNK